MKQDILNKIKAKENERNFLLRQMKMWAEAESQGIDVNNVSSFGFDPDLVPASELKRIKLAKPVFNKSNPYGWEAREVNGVLTTKPEIYNYVRMNNGDKIPLAKPIKSPQVL